MNNSGVHPQYTFAFSVKEDGKYQEVFKNGPIDACADKEKEGGKFKHHQDYMKKFGNMSCDLMCPFNEVSSSIGGWGFLIQLISLCRVITIFVDSKLKSQPQARHPLN